MYSDFGIGMSSPFSTRRFDQPNLLSLAIFAGLGLGSLVFVILAIVMLISQHWLLSAGALMMAINLFPTNLLNLNPYWRIAIGMVLAFLL